MNRKKLFFLSFAVFLLLSINNAFAKITVISVKGRCAYRTAGKWKSLRTGMTLRQGTKISTGVRSRAVLDINNHRLTVRPLTMMKIYHNSLSKKRSRTRIGLRRGSLRAKISRGKKVRTIFKISTPVATSSVRGTIEDVSYGPTKGMIIKVIEGIVAGENINGSRRNIRGKQIFVQKVFDSLPGDILSDVKKDAIVSLFDRNMTKDEQDMFDTNDDNLTDENSSTTGAIDMGKLNKAGVNITVQWQK